MKISPMPFRSVPFRISLFAVAALGLGGVPLRGTAYAAIPVCTVADIEAAESVADCPADPGLPCRITNDYDLGTGCSLDFGARDVTLATGASFDFGSGTVRVIAGSLSMEKNSLFEGRGTGSTAPDDRGGSITIDVAGDFFMSDEGTSKAEIDVAGNVGIGSIDIVAGGNVTIGGRLYAQDTGGDASGGSITIRTDGDVTILPVARIQALSGSRAFVGGLFDITADGNILMQGQIDTTGADGGDVDLAAGGSISIENSITGDANGDAGCGGSIRLVAGTSVTVDGKLQVRGSSGLDGFAGDGGFVEVLASYGDVHFLADGDVIATGATPDGSGDSLIVTARGSVTLDSGANLNIQANGAGCGGLMQIEAIYDLNHNGTMNVSGGLGGGSVDVIAGRDVTIAASVDARGRAGGAFGGGVDIKAGDLNFGTLSLEHEIDAGGGGCSVEEGCGQGGFVELVGCDLSVTGNGKVLNRGADGGDTILEGRNSATIGSGTVLRSTATTGSGFDGTVELIYATGREPVINGTVDPAATLTVAAVAACPVCGDSVVEGTETCDDGNTVGCDGCSPFCKVENCSDGNDCTIDSCDVVLGCRTVAGNDGGTCDDGNGCTGDGVCSSGLCDAGVVNCSHLNSPCADGFCNVAANDCQTIPRGNGAACDDGLFCTENEVCTGGVCGGGTARDCSSAGDQCNDGICDDAADACAAQPRVEGTPCDDGLACRDNDRCVGGTCTSDPIDCSAFDSACATGTCTEVAGGCFAQTEPDGTSCDDGLYCTGAGGSDVCTSGICDGPSRDCGPGGTCSTLSCDEGADMCAVTVTPNCCGNAITEAGEDCDDGEGNSSAPNASCRPDCSAAGCGDGVVDDLSGEECDDGGTADGDGCSAACLLEIPATVEFWRGGGSKTLDCALEIGVNNPQLTGSGEVSKRQRCRDGDALCDVGSEADSCTVRMWLCTNVEDPALDRCVPGDGAGANGALSGLEVVKPSIKDEARDVADASNRAGLLATLAPLEGNAALGNCATPLDLEIPLKRPGRTGKRTFRIRGTLPSGKRETDTIKILCDPATP